MQTMALVKGEEEKPSNQKEKKADKETAIYRDPWVVHNQDVKVEKKQPDVELSSPTPFTHSFDTLYNSFWGLASGCRAPSLWQEVPNPSTDGLLQKTYPSINRLHSSYGWDRNFTARVEKSLLAGGLLRPRPVRRSLLWCDKTFPLWHSAAHSNPPAFKIRRVPGKSRRLRIEIELFIAIRRFINNVQWTLQHHHTHTAAALDTLRGDSVRRHVVADLARVVAKLRESEKRDPPGFSMSQQFSSYEDHGIRLNITARMMVYQAPQN
ncbi:hypothetical protein MKX08_003427 [Trichoderma sp. CBMAI-0020]|nr:hypothetical protein MKX08_003427 [Trichoderma sp. CBMAI-0020]